MKRTILLTTSCIIISIVLIQCQYPEQQRDPENSFGVKYTSQIEWGKHLVAVSACHDCHSPKDPKGHGLELDTTRILSGHAPGDPEPTANLRELRSKGQIVTVGGLTSWAGSWGQSYAANLTSDPTGIGNWSEEQFMRALRHGKFKGLENGRALLPPMPWEMYKNFSDDEIKAILAYLKSTKPIRNIVPSPKLIEDL